MAGEVIDVALVAGDQVVDAQHLVDAFEKRIDEVRSKKPAPRVTSCGVDRNVCAPMSYPLFMQTNSPVAQNSPP
jgi:hypothetical protein